jgi:hypothetical protein
MNWRLMSSVKFLLLLLLFGSTFAGCSGAVVTPTAAGGKSEVNAGLSKIEVSSYDNKKVMLQDLMGANGLIIIQHRSDCPIVRRYSSEVEKIHALLADKKINVIYLNSAGGETPQKIADHIKSFKLSVPIYMDSQGVLTKGLKMQRTSEAVLLTPRYETIYQGAIDDSLDYESRKPAQHRYLLDAVAAYEYNRPVSVPQTEARGCLVE